MRNKYIGIVCLIYSGLIGYVWKIGILKNFISPSMQIYTKLALVVLALVGIVLMFIKSESKFKISDLILLLPVLMLILAGDGNLSVSFATNRLSNYSSPKQVEKVEAQEETKKVRVIDATERTEEQDETYDFTNVDFNVVDPSYSFLMNAISYSEKDNLEGKTIRVRGFVVTNADYLTPDLFMIGKFDVSCCTADASFGGFFVLYDKNKIKNNNWYEIEGVLKRGKDLYGYPIYYIKAINVKTIDSSNEDRYVYSCYSYDNGECSEVFKYSEFELN